MRKFTVSNIREFIKFFYKTRYSAGGSIEETLVGVELIRKYKEYKKLTILPFLYLVVGGIAIYHNLYATAAAAFIPLIIIMLRSLLCNKYE
jgi:hypothetical protein